MGLLDRDKVALPPYVQPDDADFEVVGLGSTFLPGTLPPDYEPQSGSVEWVTVVRASLATSATAVKRTVALTQIDEQGNNLGFISAPFQQNASELVFYLWSVSVTSGYGVSGKFAHAPLFALPFLPGWKLEWAVDSFQPGDQFTVVNLTTSRYSTGTPIGGAEREPDIVPAIEPMKL